MKTSLIVNNKKTKFEHSIFVFLKNRWVLILVLAVFIVGKVPHLLYPFYWDESTPYVPAIKEMYAHGISLLPNAISPDLSRGHPLFFYAAGALWMNIFGTSNLSLHAFGLFIALLLLIVIYEIGIRLYNKRVAVTSLLLIAGNVAFFVQSSFVLLEILIALLAFLSIYLYVIEKYIWATLVLIILFLTKESGVIAGLILGIDAFFGLFKKTIPVKNRLLKFVPTLSASVIFISFFIIQKQTYGWYFFPLHTDTILLVGYDIWHWFRMCTFKTTFGLGYVYILFITLFILAAIATVKEKKMNIALLLSIIFPIIMAYYFIDDGRYALFAKVIPLKSSIVFALFFILYMMVLYAYCNPLFYKNKIQHQFVFLLGSFSFCFVIFSSFLFFSSRYLLMSTIPMLFILAVLFDMLIQQSYEVLYYPILAVVMTTIYLSFKTMNSLGDTELGFFDGLRTQTAVIKYMESNNLYNHSISCSFLNYKHLTDRRTGFLSTQKHFIHVNDSSGTNSEFAIFDDIEPDVKHEATIKDSSYSLIYTVTYGKAWAEIYKRK